MTTSILGAGATGLAMAYLLAKSGQRVRIHDAAERPGGLLATFEVAPGRPLEYFYHHFFTHDAELNWLLEELDIKEHATFSKSTMGIYREGRIHRFDGPVDALRFAPVPWLGRLRFLASSALLATRKKYASADDQRALEWFTRWAGPRATDAIWRPMMQIKFGDAAPEVPLAWMAGRLRQRVLSRRKGGERLGYLIGSSQLLVDRLVEKLIELGVELRLGEPVLQLVNDHNNAVCGARTINGDYHADRVFSTLPTSVLSTLIEPHNKSYAEELSRIEYYGAICTVLTLDQPLSPVYWLNVADKGYDFGGVIEQTHLVPASEYDGAHVVYLSRYVQLADDYWSLSDEEIKTRQIEQLGALFSTDINSSLRQSWVFRSRHAAPVTGLHFPRLIPQYRSPIDGLYVASMCHLYPDERSVNNSVRIAAEALRAAGENAAANLVPNGLSFAGRFGAN
ncbi:MAG: FAD-dependent oxidoreductase [Planctomycetota bacterium]